MRVRYCQYDFARGLPTTRHIRFGGASSGHQPSIVRDFVLPRTYYMQILYVRIVPISGNVSLSRGSQGNTRCCSFLGFTSANGFGIHDMRNLAHEKLGGFNITSPC